MACHNHQMKIPYNTDDDDDDDADDQMFPFSVLNNTSSAQLHQTLATATLQIGREVNGSSSSTKIPALAMSMISHQTTTTMEEEEEEEEEEKRHGTVSPLSNSRSLCHRISHSSSSISNNSSSCGSGSGSGSGSSSCCSNKESGGRTNRSIPSVPQQLVPTPPTILEQKQAQHPERYHESQQSCLPHSNNTMMMSSSTAMMESQYLDTAASMMMGSTLSLFPPPEEPVALVVPFPQLHRHHPSTTSEPHTPPTTVSTAVSSLSSTNYDTTTSSSRSSGLHDFSVLLQQADDCHVQRLVAAPSSHPPMTTRNLPIVPEDEEGSDPETIPVTRTSDQCDARSMSSSSSIVILESSMEHEHHATNDAECRYHPLRHPMSTSNLSNMSRRYRDATNSRELLSENSRTNERRLAELVGASVLMTGTNTFTVAIDLHVGYSNDNSPNGSTTGVDLSRSNQPNSGSTGGTGATSNLAEQQQIMKDSILDVIGNPDLLRLWCDAIPSSTCLITVRSSEGARNAIDRTRPVDATREYEGEWIEAICRPGFVIPRKSSSPSRSPNCSSIGRFFMDWTTSLTTILGCPRASGTVTMFVERGTGQVSITLSPFPGHVQICHRVKVTALPNGKIRIEDTVRVRPDEEHMPSSIFSCCGSLFDVMQQCFLPTVDDYMDQVLSSMARLRFLIENGEDAATATTVRDTLGDRSSNMTMSSDDPYYGYRKNNVKDTLLMTAWMGTAATNSGGSSELQNPLLVRLIS
jgi:hypothetical protein